MNLMLMAEANVGLQVLEWLIQEYPRDLALVVANAENEVYRLARSSGIAVILFESSEQVSKYAVDAHIKLDLAVMAWWPTIIKQPLISLPTHGFINTHPSYLPYNRGKHYNFWSLVEQSPFGVSLHFVDESIDSGDVVAQTRIQYDWEDNGATLYAKAQSAIVSLFKETYPLMRTLNIPRRKQDLARGSFHKSGEIDQASRIDLEQQYRARDLLNLLRARTFPGYPACWFSDGGEEYEVRIEINRHRKKI